MISNYSADSQIRRFVVRAAGPINVRSRLKPSQSPNCAHVESKFQPVTKMTVVGGCASKEVVENMYDASLVLPLPILFLRLQFRDDLVLVGMKDLSFSSDFGFRDLLVRVRLISRVADLGTCLCFVNFRQVYAGWKCADGMMQTSVIVSWE